MSGRCRNGHQSSDPDFCSTCGLAVVSEGPAGQAGRAARSAEPAAAPAPCPACGAPMEPGDRFCTVCGAPVDAGSGAEPPGSPASRPAVRPAPRAAPAPPGSAGAPEVVGDRWELVIAVSPEQWAAMVASRPVSDCPRHVPPRTVTLTGDEVLVGRSQPGRPAPGGEPDVNLAARPGETDDVGISRRHARLRRSDDGWLVSDEGSKNGVYLNGDFTRRLDGRPRPVGHGDRIHLGGWTVLTLRTAGVEGRGASP